MDKTKTSWFCHFCGLKREEVESNRLAKIILVSNQWADFSYPC